MFLPSRCIARGGNANAQLRGHGESSDLIISIVRMRIMQITTPVHEGRHLDLYSLHV